jgi:uncharacterized membrane protein YdjX (TVP38/TMEM64 family)
MSFFFVHTWVGTIPSWTYTTTTLICFSSAMQNANDTVRATVSISRRYFIIVRTQTKLCHTEFIARMASVRYLHLISVIIALLVGLSICFPLNVNSNFVKKISRSSDHNTPFSLRAASVGSSNLNVMVAASNNVTEMKEQSLSNDLTDNKKQPSAILKVAVISVVSMIVILLIAATTGRFGSIDITSLLEKTVTKVGALGPYGYLYFALIYVLAEITCIPAIPLAASSGVLFGLIPGFLIVLASATSAACISFFIGRTLVREWALKMANGNRQWQAIDSAIQKQGFKVILLLRVAPLFPFSIVNYLYGLTSVDFWSYFTATLLGFAPGTLAIVYAGTAGKALFSEGLSGFPWYLYVVAGLGLALFGKIVTKFATDTIAVEYENPETTSLPVKSA